MAMKPTSTNVAPYVRTFLLFSNATSSNSCLIGARAEQVVVSNTGRTRVSLKTKPVRTDTPQPSNPNSIIFEPYTSSYKHSLPFISKFSPV